MNFQQLRYAQTLAEAGAFGLAAQICNVTQPTLSNAIAQLERDLGVVLFARTTRSVKLTPAGQDLLPAIADILRAKAALTALASQLTNPGHQLLRIGVSPLIGIALIDMVMDPFRRSHPDLDVIFREMNLAEMIRQAEAGQLDCVFGPLEPDALPGTGWQSTELCQEPLFYIAQGALTRTALPVALSDLADDTFVLVPDACGLTRATRRLFKVNHLKLKEYPGEAMSYRVLQEWAGLGIGSAILPRSRVTGGAGVPILLHAHADRPATIAYHALWRHPDAGPSAALSAFHLYLATVAPALLAGLIGPAGQDQRPILPNLAIAV